MTDQTENNPVEKPGFFASIKDYLVVQGILLAYGLSIWTYRLFLKAYLSEEKTVVLYINVFGEANLEFILLTVSVIIMTFAVVKVLRMLWKKRKENK